MVALTGGGSIAGRTTLKYINVKVVVVLNKHQIVHVSLSLSFLFSVQFKHDECYKTCTCFL